MILDAIGRTLCFAAVSGAILATVNFLPMIFIFSKKSYFDKTKEINAERQRSLNTNHEIWTVERLKAFVVNQHELVRIDYASSLASFRAGMYLNGSAAIAIVAFCANRLKTGSAETFLVDTLVHFFAGTLCAFLALWLHSIENRHSSLNHQHLMATDSENKALIRIYGIAGVLAFMINVWSATFFIFGGYHFASGLYGLF